MTGSSTRHRRLRLIVGPPVPGPSGIQEALLGEVRRLKAEDPLRPVTILVGGNYLRLHLQRDLAVRLGGHANVSFLLLMDLAKRLGTPALLDRGRKRLPELARDLLLREAVKVRSHGSYFEHIAGKEGFVEALAATLRDLKEAMVEPATLRATAGALAAGSARNPTAALSAEKLEDLATLYETYDDLLKDRRFYDDQDLMRSALDAASSGEDHPVLVYGFYDATWLQRSLLQRYLSFKEGLVLFPYQGASFEYARPLLDWLSSWIPERADLPAAGESPPVPEITLLSAPGEAREALEAVRWLVARARKASLPLGRMGLVYRSPEPYVRLVPEVMAEAGGVPHFLADGRRLADMPAVRALLLLLRVRDEEFSRRSVIDFLTVTSGQRSAALWDRLSREAGIVKGTADWRERLRRQAGRMASREEREPGSQRDRIEALEGLRRAIDDLEETLEAFPAEGTWTEMAEATLATMRRFAPKDLAIDRAEALLSTLGGLDEVASPVSLGQFIDRLRHTLESERCRTADDGEFQRSGIYVGSVMEARLLTFNALAVVGLVEKSFPILPRQDPILLDDERREINQTLGAGRLPLKTHRLEEERLLFGLLCSSATESLLLGYPRLDPATARPRNPSPFLLKIAAMAEGEPIIELEALERLERTNRVGLGALAPGDPSEALLSREFNLGVIGPKPVDPATRRRVATFLHSNPILHRALVAEEARWGEPRFTSYDGVMLRPNMVDRLREVHPISGMAISASRIEAYASCPLAYFLGDVLGLDPIEDPEKAERMAPLRRGRLIHEILSDLFVDLKRLGSLPLTPGGLDAALEVLAEAARRRFEREEARGLEGYELLWRIDKEQILEDLKRVLVEEAASDDPFIPAHFEIGYGMPAEKGEAIDPASTGEPLRIEIGAGRTVPLKGKIDRIDISRDGTRARVTDYKTGRMERYREDSLQGGTTVQLPVYMLAAEHILSQRHPGVRTTEARYSSVDRRGRFRSVGFAAEALASRREDLFRVIKTCLNGIAQGVFIAYPEPETCRRCDFRLACGEGREARFARKREDAKAADFRRMREEIP